jgi:DNA-binding winged helix-turn-helix (wHTH) protein
LPVVRFGPFEADLGSQELRRDGRRVKVQGKAFGVLVALLRNPGGFVAREELEHELWPAGTYVDFEHGLNSVVRKLREALGDDAHSPRYIETVPRQGYRFIAPVTAIARPAPPLAGATVHAGDCVAPRTIHEAVLEGRRAALAVDSA